MKKKAVALLSGGLDSLLAAKLIQDQGVHVEGINFFTGFCVEGHTHAIRRKSQSRSKRNNALWCAEQLGIKLHIIDVVDDYKQVLTNPRFGYGSNLNPCLDCKIFMVQKAHDWIQQNDFDFIITGEVIGQRPMSQRPQTMPMVAGESGAEDLLLRPLCALNLDASLPEREGWVDRNLLKGFSGRSRKPQFALAREFGFDDFAQPAGGCCFLTDESYSLKLKDLWDNQGSKQYELDDIMLLKVGRHIRPNEGFKLIISREEGETRFLSGYRKTFQTLKTISHAGPVALIDGKQLNRDEIKLAGSIVARYSQGRSENQVVLQYDDGDAVCQEVMVKPFRSEETLKAWNIS